MKDKYIETLSAFFDGEPVDADTLASALRDTEALDFLVESARLRREVQADTSRPSEEFCEAMRERLTGSESRRSRRRRILHLSLAASLVVAAAVGGYGLRGRLDRERPAAQPRVTESKHTPPMTPPSPSPAPAPANPRREAVTPSAKGVPPANLRMNFAEWHDEAL